jgi:hypothetical protein
MEMEVRRWRNNPSIVMWATSGNALGNSGSDSDPWTLGLPPTFVQENVNLRQRAREAFTWVRAIDPQRPIFGHHSDNGEVTTSNMYLNFIPLQEREEWLSHWAQNKTLPWMAVEMGTPLYSSVMRGRDGYGPQGHSEPHLTEWTSIYLGREAFALESEDYRTKVLRDRFKGGDLQKEYDPHIRNDSRDLLIWESASFTKLLDLFFVNTHRTWRTMGMSGGIIPWYHDRHPALQRVNGPSVAWIAGARRTPRSIECRQAGVHRKRSLIPRRTKSGQADCSHQRLPLAAGVLLYVASQRRWPKSGGWQQNRTTFGWPNRVHTT